MATKEQRADYYLLSLWARTDNETVADGYKAVARQYMVGLGKARSMVHMALKRQGINPHCSPSLIHAWVQYHRRMMKTGDIA